MPTAAGDGARRSDETPEQNPEPAYNRRAACAGTSSGDFETMSSQKPEARSQKSEEKNASLIQSVKNRFPDAVLSSHTYRGDATLVLNWKFLLEVARFLKEDPAFLMNFLVDVSAV